MKRKPIHQTLGDIGPVVERWLKWPVLAFSLAALLGIFMARRWGDVALLGLQLAEVVVALAVAAAAGYGALVYSDRRRVAAREIGCAAAGDDFWCADRLRERVLALAERYWRAVAAGDAAPVADDLTRAWRDYLAHALAAWRTQRIRPVLLDFVCRDAQAVGLEDWRDNHRDRVFVRVDVHTSFHASDMNNGEVIEGMPCSRQESQLWTLARGERAWLIERVQLIGGPAAYGACRVFRELG